MQVHWSLGGNVNVDVFGMELTVSLQQLMETIRRERPDMTSTAAADGTVTIVFTDIVDSTVLLSRLGDHAWLEVSPQEHNDVIRDAAAVHGGTVVENRGRRVDAGVLERPPCRRLREGDPDRDRESVR